MIDRSREASFALDRSHQSAGGSHHDLPRIIFDRREHDAEQRPEEEEALMNSTHDLDHDGDNEHGNRRRSVSPALGRPTHVRSTSTSVDLTPRLAESRNRTPSGSRRSSHDLDERMLAKNVRLSRSGLAHEVDRSSLSGSEGKHDLGDYSSDPSFPGESYRVPVNGELDASLNGHEQQSMSQHRPSRKPKSNGTAEKAGVILVSRLKDANPLVLTTMLKGIHNIFIVVCHFYQLPAFRL